MNEKTPVTGEMHLKARALLTLDNAIDVLAFDDCTVTLSTSLGVLTVDGEELHVKKMDMESGQFALEGKISGLYYADDRPAHRKGLFGKRK